jgi:hypothetical protein
MNEDPHNEQAYLEEIAPLLFGKKHRIQDHAPEGYFDGLSAKLQERIVKEEGQEAARKSPQGFFNFQNLAIAAGLAVLLALIPLLRQLIAGEEESPAYTQSLVTDGTDADLVFDLVYEPWMDEAWIMTAMEEDSLTPVYFSDRIDGEDLENYLLNEGVSEALLIEMMY